MPLDSEENLSSLHGSNFIYWPLHGWGWPQSMIKKKKNPSINEIDNDVSANEGKISLRLGYKLTQITRTGLVGRGIKPHQNHFLGCLGLDIVHFGTQCL